MAAWQRDPLLEIIDRHLHLNSEDGKPGQMIEAVLNDYLHHLKTDGVHIPEPVKAFFLEDLKEEIRELIIKRTFGKITPDYVPHSRIGFKSLRKPA